MQSNALSTWGIPATIALTAIGAALGWAGIATDNITVKSLVIVVGICICVIAIALLLLTAAARTTRTEVDRKLARYACQRCGYAPHPEDIDRGDSFPCPTCGEPLYPEQ